MLGTAVLEVSLENSATNLSFSFRDPLRRTRPDTVSCLGAAQRVPEGWGLGEGATESSRRRAR